MYHPISYHILFPICMYVVWIYIHLTILLRGTIGEKNAYRFEEILGVGFGFPSRYYFSCIQFILEFRSFYLFCPNSVDEAFLLEAHVQQYRNLLYMYIHTVPLKCEKANVNDHFNILNYTNMEWKVKKFTFIWKV